jgi:hypothetical protein
MAVDTATNTAQDAEKSLPPVPVPLLIQNVAMTAFFLTLNLVSD